MKKIVLILAFCLVFSINARADDTTFLHPIFYQQLSSSNHDFFYVLNPNKMYYENSKTGVTTSAKCSLKENQEYYIKMLCNNCNNPECSSYSQKIHTFSLSKTQMTDNNYIISHKILDKNNFTEVEEKLINDGLITIPPYQ